MSTINFLRADCLQRDCESAAGCALTISKKHSNRNHVPKPVKESNSVTGKTVSLVGMADSEDIEKDTRFLGELGKVFNSFETSTQFFSARNQIETVYQNTRRTLKKRIKNDVSLTFD